MTLSIGQCRDNRPAIDPGTALLVHRDLDRDIDLIASSLRACFAFSEHPIALWAKSPDGCLRHLPELVTNDRLRRSGAILIDTRGLDRHLMEALIDGFCGKTDRDLPERLEAMTIEMPGAT
jgi:hypothetical protein